MIIISTTRAHSEGRYQLGQASPHDLRLTVATGARCARSRIHPDAWFPVSTSPAGARREAAAALAVCDACPVRMHCLDLALRHWSIGQYGIWGGTVPTERVELRRRLAERTEQLPDTA